MSSNAGFWSKLSSKFALPTPTGAAVGELHLLVGLFDVLTGNATANLPEQALCWIVAEQKAKAGWLYVFGQDGAGSLHILAQAGEQAKQETAQRASSRLATKLFVDENIAPGDTMLAIPLLHQGNTLGAAVFLWDTQPPHLPDILGNYLGFIIAYTWLDEEARQESERRRQLEIRLESACADECQQAAELALLNSVTNAIIAGASPALILEKLCHELVNTFGVKQSAAALLDDSGQTLHVVAEYVPPNGVPSIGMDIPVSNNPSSLYVIRMKAPLAVSDVQHDIRMTPIYNLMKQRGVASMLILPLLVGEHVIGTIGVDSAEQREYSDAEIQLAVKAASLAAWAVNGQNKE